MPNTHTRRGFLRGLAGSAIAPTVLIPILGRHDVEAVMLTDLRFDENGLLVGGVANPTRESATISVLNFEGGPTMLWASNDSGYPLSLQLERARGTFYGRDGRPLP